MVIILEGSIHVAIADENRTLSSGEIEIFNINQVHRLLHTHEDNLILLININAEFAKDHCDLSKIWFAHEFGPGTDLGLERTKEINKAICALITPVINNKGELKYLTLVGVTGALLNLLVTNFDVKRIFEGNPIKLQRIWKIYDYLFHNQGYTNKASLNEIVQMTEEYLNLDYLSSQFKLLIGDTLQNLLHYLRIEHAIKLLLTTNSSLVEISIESGFSSPRYFHQKFKRIFPEGPKEFRQDNKRKQETIEHCREIIDPAFVIPRFEGLFNRCETLTIEPNQSINLNLFESDDQNSASLYLIKISDLLRVNSDKEINRILQVHSLSPYQVFGFEEILNFADSDMKDLTKVINQFSEVNIHPVFIVRANNEAMSEQITAIQQLIQNYALTYGAEQLKGWRIEIQ